MRAFILFLCPLVLIFFSCGQVQEKSLVISKKFDPAGSDSKAIEIADNVLEAMGGKENWEQTKYLSWSFFGKRALLWDKAKNRVRIESKGNDFKAILDLNTQQGRVFLRGSEMLEQDSLVKYLERARQIWINDSYWLVMPFKMTDPGVRIKYRGSGKNAENHASELVELTFDSVGVTPNNKYIVYVDPATSLVSQWDFYRVATDTIPIFQVPWKNYNRYGAILLSGNRGKSSLKNINTHSKVEESFFTSFDPVKLPAFQ